MMDCDGLCVVIPIQVIELITLYYIILYYITLHYKIKVITFAVEIKVPALYLILASGRIH